MMLQDLLNPTPDQDLPLRDTENGISVVGAKEIEVQNLDECLQLLTMGEQNR